MIRRSVAEKNLQVSLVNMLSFMMNEKHNKKRKRREHQNNEGERICLTRTNPIHVYSLPYMAFNSLVLRMRCMEEEQWWRQR
jgi:hypothetical protein